MDIFCTSFLCLSVIAAPILLLLFIIERKIVGDQETIDKILKKLDLK